MDRIEWTGDNVEAMTMFARRSDARFSFSVGSDHHNWRWYHRVARKVLLMVDALMLWAGWPAPGWEWSPPEDPTVLEIHPSRPDDDDDDEEEEYVPWHWTSAQAGDLVYLDGSVERRPWKRPGKHGLRHYAREAKVMASDSPRSAP